MLQRQSFDGAEIFSIDERELRSTLQERADRIRKDHPGVAEIILFGSFSRKNYTPFSDIDIAIIQEETGKRFVERSDEFIEYFSGIPLDVNLVVYTSDEISRMTVSGNSFINEIMTGIRL